MVNLLFISSNSKVDIIKNALQPLLKVKIDIVGDFDFGLKDVFEKRPAMVFIQDQIAGVTGESVARHIQMLLGSAAPSFVFMHDGNFKAKPVKGLYEHLIDLSQDHLKVLADIQSTLKLILGPQWQKVYVPPAPSTSDVMTTLKVPDGQRTSADQLVDDFISDLGDAGSEQVTTSYPLTDFALPVESSAGSFNFVSSPQDQLAEIVSETVRQQQETETTVAAIRDVRVGSLVSPPSNPVDVVHNETPPALHDIRKPDVRNAAEVTKNPSSVPADAAPAARSVATVQAYSAPTSPGASEKSPAPSISPADFRIEKERRAGEVAPAEPVFEAIYLTSSPARNRFQYAVVLLVVCLMGAVWYLMWYKTGQVPSARKEAALAHVSVPAAHPISPAAAIQKSVSAGQRNESAVLPSFIPLSGHDRSFAAQKPGWDRYVGVDSEFRVFRSGGKLKAVQVLATSGHVISESRLRAFLTELTGGGEYRITSHEQKHGFKVSRATANRNADLLIYRKKSAVHAFVVSLD